MKLPHVIMEIVKGEEIVGGILVPALLNRTQAKFSAAKEPVPAFDSIKEAIFELMTSEVISLDRKKRVRCLKVKDITEAFTPEAPSKQNPSGLWPIGPGDFVFNAAGEPVGIVDKLFVRDGQPELEIRPTFNAFVSYADNMTVKNGEVATGTQLNPVDSLRALRHQYKDMKTALDALSFPTPDRVQALDAVRRDIEALERTLIKVGYVAGEWEP